MWALLGAGAVLGVIAFLSYFLMYMLYMPKFIKRWLSKSFYRMAFFDIIMTVLSFVTFTSVTGAVMGVAAASTMGLLTSLSSIIMVGTQKIKGLVTAII